MKRDHCGDPLGAVAALPPAPVRRIRRRTIIPSAQFGSFQPGLMLTVKLVNTDSEIEQIAELSLANSRSRLSPETMAQEGFISWAYTSEVLHSLHRSGSASVVVMDGPVLAGYALTLTPGCAEVYPVMDSFADAYCRLARPSAFLRDGADLV